MQTPVFELLTWRSTTDTNDDDMLGAMSRFSTIVKTLPGFLYQSLYKKADDEWVCIYFWETEQEAYASNEAVANTQEFGELMKLIDKDSVTMVVLPCLQQCGSIQLG